MLLQPFFHRASFAADDCQFSTMAFQNVCSNGCYGIRNNQYSQSVIEDECLVSDFIYMGNSRYYSTP